MSASEAGGSDSLDIWGRSTVVAGENVVAVVVAAAAVAVAENGVVVAEANAVFAVPFADVVVGDTCSDVVAVGSSKSLLSPQLNPPWDSGACCSSNVHDS